MTDEERKRMYAVSEAIEFHVDNTIKQLEDGKTIWALREIEGAYEHIGDLNDFIGEIK